MKTIHSDIQVSNTGTCRCVDVILMNITSIEGVPKALFCNYILRLLIRLFGKFCYPNRRVLCVQVSMELEYEDIREVSSFQRVLRTG